MGLNPLYGSNLEQLASKGLMSSHFCTISLNRHRSVAAGSIIVHSAILWLALRKKVYSRCFYVQAHDSDKPIHRVSTRVLRVRRHLFVPFVLLLLATRPNCFLKKIKSPSAVRNHLLINLLLLVNCNRLL